jgi:4-aminobutyrate aminotransferase/(S)-3-amino-2-methylpropionate transaminase
MNTFSDNNIFSGAAICTHSTWRHKLDHPTSDWPIAPWPTIKYPLNENQRENEAKVERCLEIVSLAMKLELL